MLTGEFTILRADLLYDTGKSPNPAIDIGQIEGGYVQGVGFATTEELVYDEQGGLVTDNIWSYKPPCSKTIPLDFRVRLHPVDEARNALEALAEKHAVKSSKSAGEPGMTLGISAYFAIKRAVMDARRELTGRDDWLDDGPAGDLPAHPDALRRLDGVAHPLMRPCDAFPGGTHELFDRRHAPSLDGSPRLVGLLGHRASRPPGGRGSLHGMAARDHPGRGGLPGLPRDRHLSPGRGPAAGVGGRHPLRRPGGPCGAGSTRRSGPSGRRSSPARPGTSASRRCRRVRDLVRRARARAGRGRSPPRGRWP